MADALILVVDDEPLQLHATARTPDKAAYRTQDAGAGTAGAE
jgi:hypothetical protein